MLQWRHFQTLVQLFAVQVTARACSQSRACSRLLRRARLVAVQPLRDSKRFEELTTFLSHMAALYKVELAEYTPTVVDLLRRSAASMTASLRRALVQACSFRVH